jgi:Glycosyl hydrolases family 39
MRSTRGAALLLLATLVAACTSASKGGSGSGARSATGAGAGTSGSSVTSTCTPLTPPAGTHPTPAAPAAAVTPTRTDTVTVDLEHTLGPVDDNLLGVVWNTGDSLAALRPIGPPTIRVDGSLQDASKGPNQLDLGPLLAKVAEIRSIGAQPLVILSYMPSWLGSSRAGTTKDPTRVGPSSLEEWQALVTKVVRTLATAKQPADLFEVWNEPDVQIFWQDTPEEFVQTALATQRAVAQVKAETGKPLEVGGPAAALGYSQSLVPWLTATAAAHLPLDFLSWHLYANSPYLGPDGPEGNLPENVYKALAKRNPAATPLEYATSIASVKATVGAALAGSGLHPRYLVDEWNVSAGGLDVRNDAAEGASLDAGILTEMEESGLDGADFYRAVSDAATGPGDWGMVTVSGDPKPSWWVFRAWRAMSGMRLQTGGADPSTGLFARASRDGANGCVDLLLSNFVATGSPARQVTVDLVGSLPNCHGRRSTTLATLDTSSTALDHPRPVDLGSDGSVSVPMATQSVALLRTGCTAS